MTSTTIKVPTELRDRLAELAKREHTTLAGAIARSLDRAETAAFWEEVRGTMSGAVAQALATDDAERLASTLTDGLDPDEDWTDVL
jgi:predicted transcriptional regulator